MPYNKPDAHMQANLQRVLTGSTLKKKRAPGGGRKPKVAPGGGRKPKVAKKTTIVKPTRSSARIRTNKKA